MAGDDYARILRRYAGVISALAGGFLFVAFYRLGELSGAHALIGLAAVIAAAWIAYLASETSSNAESRRPQARAFGSDQLLQVVVAAIPDPALALDRDGRVLALNARVTGIAPALRRGEPVSLALRAPDVVDAIRRAASSGKPERVEFVERVAPGRWLEALISPIGAQSEPKPDRAGMLLVIFHDLTQIRRVEEMRADFIANASHELRTPLAALSGFIETLKGPAREDAVARERFLGIMESQATRMARLIDDLLSLSRIEVNEHLRPDKPVDLIGVVRQVVDTLQTLARDREVEVKIEAPPGSLIVPGNRDELIRVFENLIENALKYGASGKRVEITVARGKAPDGREEAVASVRDFGPGVAAEHLPRLTERFYRVDVADSRALGGTGLGLALVKHIVNRHRGVLTIESKPGQGATFTVRLPMSTDISLGFEKE
ncbi:MAG: PAS domain-containing protein [Pseudorhodoplanes sp.]|nr:PAS domain-containing protein [Pseudorhodoplanes sp.]